MHSNEALPVLIGTALWVIALVLLLVLRPVLSFDQQWWVWTCVTGIAGGFFGLWYVWRRKRAGLW